MKMWTLVFGKGHFTVFSHLKRRKGLALTTAILGGIGLIVFAILLFNPTDPVYADLGTEFIALGVEPKNTQDIAFGDWDGDGDLDAAVGNSGQPVQVFENVNGSFGYYPVWESSEALHTNSVAWGDWDNDGDLDLAVGNGKNNFEERSQVYENLDGTLSSEPVWESPVDRGTSSVAWGDMNGDGLLDLALGSDAGDGTQVFANTGGDLTLVWAINESASKVAWAHLNNDDYLDLIVGTKIFLNTANGLPITESSQIGVLNSFAFVDWDHDGDLDAVGLGARPYEQGSYYCSNNGNGEFPSCVRWGLDSSTLGNLNLGDWNGDGKLEYARGYKEGDTFVYETGANGAKLWQAPHSGKTTDVVWADINGDGAPELAVGTEGNPGSINVIYLNSSNPLSPDWDTFYGSHVQAWADIDGDQDFDQASGDSGGGDGDPAGGYDIWRNDNGEMTTIWSSDHNLDVTALAWGDVDGDSDLDLVAASDGELNRILVNMGTSFAEGWVFSDTLSTTSLAWEDWDNDGDLDLAVGRTGGVNQLFENNTAKDSGIINFTLAWSSTVPLTTTTLAWGDWDDDGDPDLAIGNSGSPNQVYENINGETLKLAWISTLTMDTTSLSWGDWDGDGDLDLAVGNAGDVDQYDIGGQPNQIYENLGGMLSEIPVWDSGIDQRETRDIAWGDVDNDGDLDLAIKNYNDGLQIYVNRNGSLTLEWETSGGGGGYLNWIDWENDGDLDLVALKQVNGRALGLLLNLRHDQRAFFNNPPYLNVTRPVSGGFSTSYVPPVAITSTVIPITYTLFDSESDPIARVEAYYSLNGGGQWFPAIPVSNTQTTNLATSPTGTEHTFLWDTFASGFFGQSNNVVVRMEAYSWRAAGSPTETFLYPNSTPDTEQRAVVSATTYPFRVRGTQMQVFSGTIAAGNEVANAMVLRQPAGSGGPAEPIRYNGQILYTDADGYLQGRGEIGTGDHLVALLPVMSTQTSTLYYTSGTPTLEGLEMDVVSEPGVQQLVVSADNPLVVYDLDVSLEWDAREDEPYLQQLEADLQETSRRLYDISNGQAALGQVRVFQNKEGWLTSHIQIHASNAMQPNADLGGSVISPTAAILSNGEVITNGYLPGQVRMPTTWNRFGNPGGDSGVDWPRALAHELGHYFFFLTDNYMGLDADGRLIQTDCQGSVMTDAYREDYSELVTDALWIDECLQTVAQYTMGKGDWAMAVSQYPALDGSGGNAGPGTFPLALTQVTFVEPETPPDVLDDPSVYLVEADGTPLFLPANGVQAYQFETQGTPDPTDDRIIPLGVPNGQVLLTRGAGPGDRVCVLDNSQTPRRIGCNDNLTVGNPTVMLQEVPGWQPDIIINPITTTLVAITVTQANVNGDLYVQVFPMSPVTDTGVVTAPITLMQPIGEDVYKAAITLDTPTFEGFVQVWISGTQQIDVNSFFFGGGWGPNRYGWGPNRYGWGPNRYGWGPNRYGWGVGRLGWGAPIVSGNGQVTLFDINYMFGDTPPYTLQSLSGVPNLPTWLTPVGEAYRVLTDTDFPEPGSTPSIQFGYLQRNVPDAFREHEQQIYYLPEGVSEWQALPTSLNANLNLASALMPGAGVYVLASTIEVKLLEPGWNSFSYPVTAIRLVEEALASVAGKYTSVLPATAPWLLYDSTVLPEFQPIVNNLAELEFGSYQIYATETVTLYLKVDAEIGNQVNGPQDMIPPATFYGWIMPTAGFTPTVGMPVVAQVNGVTCGQGTVIDTVQPGTLAYTLQVSAINEMGQCGLPGRTVVFQVGEWTMDQNVLWDNSQAWFLSLSEVAASTVVDDRACSIQYGGWESHADPQAVNGCYRASSTTNQWLVFKSQQATTLSLITYKGPDQGIAAVYIDGVFQRQIDLYATEPDYQVFENFTGLTPGVHTVQIYVTGTKNENSTGTEVRVDGFWVNGQAFDDNSPAFTFPGWINYALQGALNGNLRMGYQPNTWVEFTTTGDQFSWLITKCPNCGQALILVDGGMQIFAMDTYAPTWSFQQEQVFSGLGSGTHTIRIKVLGIKHPNSGGILIPFDGYITP